MCPLSPYGDGREGGHKQCFSRKESMKHMNWRRRWKLELSILGLDVKHVSVQLRLNVLVLVSLVLYSIWIRKKFASEHNFYVGSSMHLHSNGDSMMVFPFLFVCANFVAEKELSVDWRKFKVSMWDYWTLGQRARFGWWVPFFYWGTNQLNLFLRVWCYTMEGRERK